jgi:hypothetical protein
MTLFGVGLDPHPGLAIEETACFLCDFRGLEFYSEGSQEKYINKKPSLINFQF